MLPKGDSGGGLVIVKKGIIKKSVDYTLFGTITSGMSSALCEKPIPDDLFLLGTTLVAVSGDHAEWIKSKQKYWLQAWLQLNYFEISLGRTDRSQTRPQGQQRQRSTPLWATYRITPCFYIQCFLHFTLPSRPLTRFLWKIHFVIIYGVE